MKNIGKLAVLGAALAVSSSLAFADSIVLGSYGLAGLSGAPSVTANNSIVTTVSDELFPNDTTGCGGGNAFCLPPFNAGALTPVGTTSVDLNPETTWAANLTNSSWVGINATAGPQSTSNPQYGYYVYSTMVSTTGTYSGTLNIQADDTTAVYLNGLGAGNLLTTFGGLGSDAHCADNGPSCLASTGLGLTLGPGTNTLYFVVEQAGVGPTGGTGDPSGVDFSGTLVATPEPSSLMLLGTGLSGVAGMLFRRRRTA